MDDVLPFGLVIGVFSLAGLLAVLSNRVSERIMVPAPAIFLAAAAVASDLVPSLAQVPVLTVQRVVTVMLILLLFDGGMHIGWARFRTTTTPILLVGVLGTALTAAGVAAASHLVLGLDWRSGLLLGIALAPTDPAVVFSVLGRREVSGRSGTLLEGESGANDPVGIAAMAAVLAVTATGSAGTGGPGRPGRPGEGAGAGAGAGASGSASDSGWTALGHGLGEFALEMVVGGAVGVAGAYLLSLAMRRLPLPTGALYPLQTLLGAGAIYGLATLAHGSGFLAVFVAGILVGDIRAPYKADIERFHSSLASLAEIVAFAMLGLTVSLAKLAEGGAWITGLVLAVLLALVIRPALVGLLLLPLRLGAGERVFVMWAGLKGAVPILLGTYLLSAAVPGAERLYQIVVVVVAFSVVVQGGLVPLVARLAHVPMRERELEPWALGMRLRDEPTGLCRCHVTPGSTADGARIADLPLGEHTWISMISRNGALVPVHGHTTLEAGDEVLLLTDPNAEADPRGLFVPTRP